MTHIENIPHILQYGITHATSPNANPDFVPIGDGSLIATRSNFVLDNGKQLGEYIPFYLGYRMPMLYVIQHGYNMVNSTPPQDIVYLVSSVEKIMELGKKFVFTDGHAIDLLSTQYSQSDIGKIYEVIDWEAVKAKYWKDENDLDKKRRKEAELLVSSDIEPQALLGYVVYNNDAKEKLRTFGIEESKVIVKRDYYF
jgi:hypothetical protein